MSRVNPFDMAASVRQRLLNLSREKGEDFQLVLNLYGLERLLYRLGRSEHRVDFVLKGAMLFRVWGEQSYRLTRDLDLLGCGDATSERLKGIFIDGSLYTGYTNDLVARIAAHNAGRGAKYTASRRPVHLVYTEPADSRSAAMRRELQIKRWTKAKKEALITDNQQKLKRLSKRHHLYNFDFAL